MTLHRAFVSATMVLTTAAFTPSEPDDVPALIAQARGHARTSGEALWPGFGSAPFGLLLVETDGERLFCQAAPSGFTASTPDPATGCDTAVRPKSGLPTNLLAAMPVFGPPSTIVVGTPAATGRSPAAWTRILQHEHFHQWQAALPGYYARVDALDLKDGDETGMWMLNFPAPYTDPAAVAAHAAASTALSDAIQARGTPGFKPAMDRYLAARAAFSEALGARSWRYVELQLWQEGVARWTEIQLGLSHPDPAVRASAETLERQTLEALAAPDLAAQGRLFAYAYGAGEAMLLEACGPEWRTAYVEMLSLGPLLDQASRRCGAG